MNRPQSAKPGHKGFWGQSSADDINDHNINNNQKHQNRKQVKILKPDLTTHDFARILPRKIHQDKERLYSQALQLKQNYNEVVEQNIRMKTKITVLQKEKIQMNRYIETGPEVFGGKGNSRINIYNNKPNEKDNMIIRNLKTIVRELRSQKETLQVESQKIKKMIKYTKINELEIEKMIISDENNRLNTIIEELNNRYMDQEDLQSQIEELKKYLEQQIEEKNQMKEDQSRYQEIIESLEEKMSAQSEKYANKQRKILRDLNGQKRKSMALQRKTDELSRQLQNMRQNQVFIQQNKKKLLIKPQRNFNKVHTNPSNPSKETNNQNNDSRINKQLQIQYQTIKSQNESLQKQMKELKQKLKKVEGSNIFVQERVKSQLQQNSLIKDTSSKKIKIPYNDIKAQPDKSKMFAQAQEPSYQQQNQEDYDEEFEAQDISNNKQGNHTNKEEEDKLQKFKKDFEENQEEEELFNKKLDKKQKKVKEQSKIKEKDKKKRKKTETKQEEYKPNKKILAQIKQLLTYRMKSQRYPFQDLKSDIQAAETNIFSYVDLCNMFVNEPFYLTSQYTKVFLQYCYQKDKISHDEIISNQVLVTKLRKCIDNFQIMEEAEEKQMIVRIAEMTSTYPRQLQIAFQNIKNGEETVARKDLIEMFQKLELEDKYIELIISELSLCSDDLDHLNFHGFFQRFYIQDESDYVENNPIEQQGQESQQSYKHSSRVKKQNIKKNNKVSSKHTDNEQARFPEQYESERRQNNVSI